MKFNKIFVLMMIVLIGLMGLTACSSTTSTTSEKPEANQEQQEVKDDFPTEPVKIYVHTKAGGPTDLMARELAKASESFLGQSIVIENKPGGSGATQMAAVLAAEADGYTLATITPSQIGQWNSNLKNQFGMDSFSYVTGVQIDPYIIVVNSASPYKSLEDVVKALKDNPGSLSVGGYGSIGSGHNIAWNIFAEKAGVEANWTPYESTGDAVTALLGQHIDMANSNPGQVAQYVKTGQLRILGVMADKRLEDYPDVPTYAEAGFNVDTAWAQFRGIYAKAGVPKERLDKLSEAFLKGMATEEFKTYMKHESLMDANMDSDAFTSFVKRSDQLTIDWMSKLSIQ